MAAGITGSRSSLIGLSDVEGHRTLIFIVFPVLDFLVRLLHSEDEVIIGNTALCISHCADLSKMQLIP